MPDSHDARFLWGWLLTLFDLWWLWPTTCRVSNTSQADPPSLPPSLPRPACPPASPARASRTPACPPPPPPPRIQPKTNLPFSSWLFRADLLLNKHVTLNRLTTHVYGPALHSIPTLSFLIHTSLLPPILRPIPYLYIAFSS